jgi:hypothetical protein
MFFQEESASAAATDPASSKPESFNINDVRIGLNNLTGQIQNTFTQGRERVFEFQRAVTDSLPGVRSLGGDIKDVGRIIQEVGVAARRNVVANEEEIESLFAASKILGISAQQITDSFLNVGVGIEEMSEKLNDSIDYVRGIGGNARQVMQDVQKNMDQMNRYQFEGGVVGLTKMAAQASMLRFNMTDTFAMAEKVLSPEGAIEVASAFQRLGVAAGNLVDPFALMNASINDPGALQDSLAEVSKQYTYFDEKSRTYKMNPQGVLILREMEQAAGLSAGSLSKMGLAAAELDDRLEAVNEAGLSIVNEEDKQYLANIAKLGKDGTYQVTLKDGTQKELADLSQPEFEKLIEAQKSGPKTMEELQRAQLSVDEIMKNDIAAIKYAVLGGILTDENIQDLLEGTRTIADITGQELNKSITTQDMRKFSEENLTGGMTKAIEDLLLAGESPEKVLPELMKSAANSLGGLSQEAIRIITESSEGITEKLQEEGGIAAKMSNVTGIINTLASELGTLLPKPEGTGGTNTEDDFWTNIKADVMSGPNRNLGTVADQVREQKSLIELLGEIKVNVNFQDMPTGLSSDQKEQITKTFSDKINEQRFKDYIVNVTTPNSAFRGGAGATY